MADFSREKKYDYNWQSAKFKDLLFKGNNVSDLLNDAGYITLKDIPSTTGSIDTGSLLTTASFLDPNLTFEKGDKSTFNVDLSTLTVTYAVTSSYSHTASYVNPLNQNVQLTGSLYLSTPGVASIYFTGSGSPGQLTWNDTDGTLELGLKGGVVKTEIGQGLVTRVVNKTVPNVNLSGSNYQVVVVAGAQGQRLAVKLAQADNDANSAGTLGIIAEDIAKNQEGFIVTVGLLKDRNTTGALQGETWSDGDILYLSPTTAGAITNIKPQAPQHTVIVGYVEYAHANNGKIYVKIDNGYEIDELHNVRITTSSLTAGQLLVRSGSNATGVWINSNQLTGSYAITGSLTISGSSTFTNIGPAVFSGSVTGTNGITGSLFGTSSYATQALSASYAPSTILYNSTSPVSVTGTTSETLIASVPISTNISNTILRASFIVVVTTLGAAAPRTRMRIGTIANPTSVQLSSQTQLGTNAVGSANAVSMYRTMPVVGGSSGNIKVIAAGSNIISDYASSTTYDTISIDWTTQQYIYFTIVNNTLAAVTQCYGVLLEQLKQ